MIITRNIVNIIIYSNTSNIIDKTMKKHSVLEKDSVSTAIMLAFRYLP